MTIALHAVFHTPEDKIVWDVGHQAYVHKLLTGRYEQFSTIRTYGGLSGFRSAVKVFMMLLALGTAALPFLRQRD